MNESLTSNWKKGFLTISIGQALSLIGSNAVQFSLIWWLSSETASPMMLSLAGLCAFLPQFLLAPFAGVWVDRFHRKTVLICADLFIGIVATLFAISFFLWNPPYWLGCVVLGIRAMGNVFHMPAMKAAIPLLVPEEELTQANSLSQSLQTMSLMLSPILGAMMYGLLSLPFILLLDLAGAIIASVTVAIVKFPDVKQNKLIQSNMLRELKEGSNILFKDKKLSAVTVVMVLCLIFFMPIATFYPLMTSNYFNATAWHASATNIFYGLGMFAGAVATGKFGSNKNKLSIIAYSLLFTGIVSFFSGVLPPTMLGFWLFASLCLLTGAGVNAHQIAHTVYIQQNIPQEAQGRVFSLIGSLLSVSTPIGLGIAGPVAEYYGVSAWFVISGVAVTLIIILYLLISKYYLEKIDLI